MTTRPALLHTVIDTRDTRRLAEFYRELLGLQYPEGRGPDQNPEADEWLVLADSDGRRQLAFQLSTELIPTTWPDPSVPMQLHLDMTLPDRASLEAAREHAESLGAQMLLDRGDDQEEPLYVLADLDGHPFCIFVG